LKRAEALFCLAAMCLAACSTAGRQSNDEPQRGDMSTQCIGRFRFQVPDSLALAARSQRIYGVEVSTAPVSPFGAASAWSERVAEIRKMRAPEGKADPVVRSFEIEPGVPGIWYFNNPAGIRMLLESAKVVDGHVLRLVRAAPEGKESSAETLVKHVIEGYAPGVTDYGFCVGYGAITMEPSLNEATDGVFENPRVAGLEIRMETATVNQPDEGTYSDLEEEKSYVEGTGANLKVLLERERTAAGLSGKEIRIEVTPKKGDPLVRFTWHFAGTPRNASQPKIDMVGSAPPDQRAQLEAAWEAVLQNMRPIPVRR
jgi:hypothetical protein